MPEGLILKKSLAEVAEGKAFLLQGGDCAESLKFHPDNIRDTFKVLLQMSLVCSISISASNQTRKNCGQFSKPRSAPTEKKMEKNYQVI